MAITYTPINVILSYFETGDFPTQPQFAAAWTSMWHKSETIPQESIDGLKETLQAFASNETYTNHIEDSNAHAGYLAKLDASNLNTSQINAWKSKLQIEYLATIDSTDADGNVYTKEQIAGFLNHLVQSDNEVATVVDEIKAMLISNDISLNELQEIVDFIKKNRDDIEILQEISVGKTSDDKIQLTGDYNRWGGITLQNQLNDLMYEKVQNLENGNQTRYRQVINTNSFITHSLNTYDFVAEAYDIITMYKIPIKVRIHDTNTVYIEFDSQPVNDINITIKQL